MGGRAGGVNKFGAVFIANFERVDAGGADGLLEFAGRIVNENAAFGVGGDVYVAILVDRCAAVAGADGLTARRGFEMVRDVGELELISGLRLRRREKEGRQSR